MEEGGMTDLQFRSWVRLMIRILDNAMSKDTEEELLVEIDKIKQDLRSALQD